MNKYKQALETIKKIELYHKEIYEDEDMDGEWVYEENCVYDGKISDIYPEEIKVLEKALNFLEEVLVNE